MIRRSLKRRTWKDIFAYAGADILDAINVVEALEKLLKGFTKELLEKENLDSLVFTFLNPEQKEDIFYNNKWLVLQYLGHALSTIFIYPILVPVFTIIKLPFELALHACINTIEAVKKWYKPAPAKSSKVVTFPDLGEPLLSSDNDQQDYMARFHNDDSQSLLFQHKVSKDVKNKLGFELDDLSAEMQEVLSKASKFQNNR